MPLGSTNTDNNREQRRYPTIYSPISGYNTFSTVDPSRISFSFWNRMLKITITPMSGKKEDGTAIWDTSNAGVGYLSHTKAAILANEIKLFLEDPISYNSNGIISNETLITISNGEEFNTPGIYLVLRKIDKETGKTLSSFSYQFNTNFHSSIRGYNEQNASFEIETAAYDYIEVQQFVALLESYAEAMTYAQAYAVVDALNSERSFREMSETIMSLAKSLGVSRTPQEGGSNRSVFNQRNNRNPVPRSNGAVQHVSPEDIEEDLFD